MNWGAVAAIAACISVLFSMLAVAVAVYQIRLSNRQSLFDRRLNVWLKVQELVSLCQKGEGDIERGDEPIMVADCIFERLTNTTLLQEITPAIHHTLERDYQLKLHLKLDEIKHISQEAKYAFKGGASVSISSFVFDYQSLLFALYQYQCIVSKMKEWAQERRLTLEDASRAVNEMSYRSRLFEAEERLSDSCAALTKREMVEKVERQIRL